MLNARAALLLIPYLLFIATPADAGTLTLEWDPATDLVTTGYIVWTGTTSGDYSRSIDVGLVTSFTIGGLAEGTTFFFVVQSYNAEGEASPLSPEVSGTPVEDASCTGSPGTPMLSSRVSGDVIELSWSAGSGDGVTSYRLDVGSAPGASDIGSSQFDAETRTFTTTAPPGTYWLRLTVANACGVSSQAADASITVAAPMATTPGPPTEVRAAVIGDSVRLSWTAPESREEVTHYLIDIYNTAGQLLRTFATASAGRTFAQHRVAVGNYVVSVRAVSDAGVGAPSNPVFVRIRPRPR